MYHPRLPNNTQKLSLAWQAWRLTLAFWHRLCYRGFSFHCCWICFASCFRGCWFRPYAELYVEGKPWNSPPLQGYLSRLCPEIQAVSVYSFFVQGLYFSVACKLYFAICITKNYFSTVCSCGFQNTGKLPCHQRLAHYKYNQVIRARYWVGSVGAGWSWGGRTLGLQPGYGRWLESYRRILALCNFRYLPLVPE